MHGKLSKVHHTGKGVFARLKFESGVHRVQRVPTTEASGRIHTSAVTVAVLPEADEVDVAIEMNHTNLPALASSSVPPESVDVIDGLTYEHNSYNLACATVPANSAVSTADTLTIRRAADATPAALDAIAGGHLGADPRKMVMPAYLMGDAWGSPQSQYDIPYGLVAATSSFAMVATRLQIGKNRAADVVGDRKRLA